MPLNQPLPYPLSFLAAGGRLVFLFLLFFSGSALCQHPDALLDPRDMKEDLNWLKGKILHYHPACLDSLRADSVGLAFDGGAYEAENFMHELQFLKLVRKTLISLRCGHTSAIPSPDFYQYYKRARPKPLFPLQVYANEDDLVVRFNGSSDSSIAIGDKLLSINQEPCADIARSIMEFLPGDGYHSSFKKFHLSLNFPTYYLFHKGPSYAYEAGVLDSAGRYSSHVFSLRGTGKGVSKPFPERSVRILFSDDFRALGVLSSNPRVAWLKIYGFGGNTGWYKKAFRRIREMGVQHLILDLRGNSGGHLFNANTLLTYLVADTFSFRFERADKKIKLDGRSNMNLAMRWTMKVFSWLPKQGKRFGPSCDKTGNLLVNRFLFRPVKRNHYDGKLVVLMDGGTFSASSLVAAKLRKKRQTQLVGDESGGGANGSNAMLMPTLQLPKTKIRVTLPLYRIRHETNGLPGRGLIPDLYLLPDLVKKVKGIDTELEYLGRNLIWFEKAAGENP